MLPVLRYFRWDLLLLLLRSNQFLLDQLGRWHHLFRSFHLFLKDLLHHWFHSYRLFHYFLSGRLLLLHHWFRSYRLFRCFL